MNDKTATIIGNGIVGLAAAYHLRRAGYAVTVIDRGPVDQGTSTGNAGAIAAAEILPIAEPGLWKRVPGMLADPLGPLHFRAGYLLPLIPWMARFLQACRPEDYRRGIDALAAILGQCVGDHKAMLSDIGATHLLNGDGAMFVYRSEASRDTRTIERTAREEHGIEMIPLGPDELRQYEPCLGGEAGAAYYTPVWSSYRNPKELVVTLADALRAGGVTFETGTAAGLVRRAGGVSGLSLEDGRILPVENLVIAAGAWSTQLSRQLGEPFPLEADRGYNTTLPNPGIEMRRFVTFAEDSFIASPMSIGLRIGGAVEMGGLNEPPNFKRSVALAKLAKRYLPDLNTEGGTQWMGHRPGTPDSIPVIDRSASADNVFYAFGHGHLGLTMSMTTGKLVTELLTGQTPGIDMTPYRIDRYRR